MTSTGQKLGAVSVLALPAAAAGGLSRGERATRTWRGNARPAAKNELLALHS
jgi:hypothetical protein